jgi:hypothetical protein
LLLNWFLTTLQLFKFRPMLPHLVRLRLSQAHGDNTTAFAPCQEVFYQFSENCKNSVLENCSSGSLGCVISLSWLEDAFSTAELTAELLELNQQTNYLSALVCFLLFGWLTLSRCSLIFSHITKRPPTCVTALTSPSWEMIKPTLPETGEQYLIIDRCRVPK